MPSKVVVSLMSEVAEIKKTLNDHLLQSGGIQTQLRFNTWLTGVILVALLAQFLKNIFH